MRILLQRVSSARVEVEGKAIGAVERGLLLLVGVHQRSLPAHAATLAQKCAELRSFQLLATDSDLSFVCESK